MLGFPLLDAPNELFFEVVRENDLQRHELIALPTLDGTPLPRSRRTVPLVPRPSPGTGAGLVTCCPASQTTARI
jgi:hypothetical protein